MSRTITIPKNNKPFIVNINNREYIYRGGETVEVPDEVAEVIEDALELEPKPKRYLGKLALLANGTLTEITENDLMGITEISGYAFYYIKNLRSIEIPLGVNKIGSYSIAYCSNITHIEIPNSVEVISFRAFSGCNNLTTVIFADNSKLVAVDEHAFTDCTSLTKVVLKAKKPPSIQANTFSNVPTTCVFEVPAESVEAYKSTANWSAFANQIVAIKE